MHFNVEGATWSQIDDFSKYFGCFNIRIPGSRPKPGPENASNHCIYGKK